MKYAALLANLILAACGADGAPERPEPGVAISGDVSVGITNAPPAE